MEGVGSAGEQRLDFMTLLVEELRNQNPLEPMDHQQMAAQLAQFSQLEETENMNTNLETINETISQMDGTFQGAMLLAEFEYARSLLDQEVSFQVGENGQIASGPVEAIRFVSGHPVLNVEADVMNDQGQIEQQQFTVTLDEITSIAK